MSADPAPSAVEPSALDVLKALVAEAEEHRTRYNNCGTEYWNGRRDEAGWFRDKIEAVSDAVAALRAENGRLVAERDELAKKLKWVDEFVVTVERKSRGLESLLQSYRDKSTEEVNT